MKALYGFQGLIERRMVAKGANPRFVLTNMELPPQKLYKQFYIQRGDDIYETCFQSISQAMMASNGIEQEESP